MNPQYIAVQTTSPDEKPGHPGAVAEGWFILEDNVVILTDRDGKPLHHPRGKQGYQRELGPGETPKQVAGQLLREKRGARPADWFNAPISYPPISIY